MDDDTLIAAIDTVLHTDHPRPANPDDSRRWVKDFEPWTCDHCTAGCTFEAMQMCARRTNIEAECGYEKDQPLALDKNGVPSREGCFEFVQPKVRFKGRIPSSVVDHYQYLNDTMETRKP